MATVPTDLPVAEPVFLTSFVNHFLDLGMDASAHALGLRRGAAERASATRSAAQNDGVG